MGARGCASALAKKAVFPHCSDPKVHKIAIANPAHAPYGRAAVAALQKAGLYEKLKSKLVFGENISQAAQFVQSGNAQIGHRRALSGHFASHDSRDRWLVPAEFHPPAGTGCRSDQSRQKTRTAAATFLDFVKSPEGREILAKYGFTLAQSPASGGQAMNIESLWLSFRLAITVSVILLVLGMPLAYWLAFIKVARQISSGIHCCASLGACPPRCLAFMRWSPSVRAALLAKCGNRYSAIRWPSPSQDWFSLRCSIAFHLPCSR